MKPLIDSLFVEVNPIPVKAALHLMGKIDLEYRLPLCPPEQSSIDLLTRELKAYGLI
jgi:4-hydroxy-tetrahydrodipicolinate synthase